METHSEATRLCSLSEWSVRHIRDVFEARSEEECLRAISSTFSEGLNASINDMPLSREKLSQLVLAMQKNSADGLKVQWQQMMEVPRDAVNNRDGFVGGIYIIRGIQKWLPGALKPVAFERHKTVAAKIESESTSSHCDSRRIVSLVIVASDIQVDRRTSWRSLLDFWL